MAALEKIAAIFNFCEYLMTIITQREPIQRGKYRVRNDAQGRADRTVNGICFASKKEAKRFYELTLLLNAGKISVLECQPRYEIVEEGILICTYVADFRYVDMETMKLVVEDVKGVKTAVYKIKKKLMKAKFGIEIQEI